MAARKDDLIKYGRKLLKNDTALWRDPEIIAEVLGLAEDTEHRGNILIDIELKFSEKKVSLVSEVSYQGSQITINMPRHVIGSASKRVHAIIHDPLLFLCMLFTSSTSK